MYIRLYAVLDRGKRLVNAPRSGDVKRAIVEMVLAVHAIVRMQKVPSSLVLLSIGCRLAMQ